MANVPPTPPPSVPPVSPQPFAPPPRKGLGCFGIGCLIVAGCAGLLLVVAALGTWWVGSTFAGMISTSPIDVRIDPPTEMQAQSANAKVDQLRTALENGEKVRVEFTGDEINTLIVQHRDFKEARGKVRVAIANSEATVDLSTELDEDDPDLKGKYFNGTVRFTGHLRNGVIIIDPKDVRMGKKSLPKFFFRSELKKRANRLLNEVFQEEVMEDRDEAPYWGQVEEISFEGDRVVIATKSGGGVHRTEDSDDDEQ